MAASSSNLETEQPVQSVDIVMLDAPDQSEDIYMPDAPEDRNVVSSEDGTQQFGRGRPQTFSVDQSNLYNSSAAMSRSEESIPHGQEDPTSEVINRETITIYHITRVYLGSRELTTSSVITTVQEHQSSHDLDGEDTIMRD
ncbi:uncharacterized protein FTJAE_5233 [Fusarium tjaetaba]|uniref:Uncharacterized protein n=1 Tax=Fusarium tjaetaba TaxID=1567544 RepID=A0A8H5VXY2_9HYPO|nr:uncharacterized protein FTJAE_5233 [Fusarium tjaetaba]KAF5638570.1 hypothetical protein FTJAE_5233 [Fusarium tjaetaba]